MAAAAAGSVVVLSLIVIALQLRGPASGEPVVTEVFFFDLGSGKLFVGRSDQVPPIDAPSGKLGVRAFLFTCGKCTPDEWFVGYLQMYGPQEKKLIERATARDFQAPTEDLAMALSEGEKIGRPDGSAWFAINSEQGRQLRDGIPLRCGGIEATVNTCSPADAPPAVE